MPIDYAPGRAQSGPARAVLGSWSERPSARREPCGTIALLECETVDPRVHASFDARLAALQFLG
jgi:hypothetical protein